MDGYRRELMCSSASLSAAEMMMSRRVNQKRRWPANEIMLVARMMTVAPNYKVRAQRYEDLISGRSHIA